MKIKKVFSIFFSSVFSKLLIILLLTGVLIHIAVIIFFRLAINDIYTKPFRQNITEYFHYIAEDIGDPPKFYKAEYIAARSGFDIFYKGGNDSWSTSKKKISYDELISDVDLNCFSVHHFKRKSYLKKRFDQKEVERSKKLISLLEKEVMSSTDKTEITRIKNRINLLKKKPEIKFGKINKRLAILYEKGNDSMIFYKSDLSSEKPIALLVTLLLVLSFIVLIAYYFIRKVLKPIKLLTNGVESVSNGNLTFQIKNSGSDELGQLASAFNGMTKQIQKMLHTKEKLLIDVSHELRSPITRVKVALEFIEESKSKNSINEDILEIESMITEILESARLVAEHGKPDLKLTSIKDLIFELIETNKEYNKSVAVKDFSENRLINIDSRQIKIVLKNILNNSIKYSENKEININLRNETGYTLIEIIDNGKGIPESELPYIFEPFYRVDKSRSRQTGGYGLGLNLCKNIMEAHNGKIKAESKNMKGTTISLYFPHRKIS